LSTILIPILVAVVPTVVAALIGVWTYREQKKVDRENYVRQKDTDRSIELRAQRKQVYEGYLTAYRKYTSLYDFDPQPADNSETVIKAVNEYWLAYSNLFHIASDPVLSAVSDFHNWAWLENPPVTKENVDRFRDLYARIIIAMREDVSERTNLSLAEIQDRLPFNFVPSESTESEAAKGG
jgi:uncharacterized protein YxeA